MKNQASENARASPKVLTEAMDKCAALVLVLDERLGKLKGVVELKAKLWQLNETLKRSQILAQNVGS